LVRLVKVTECAQSMWDRSGQVLRFERTKKPIWRPILNCYFPYHHVLIQRNLVALFLSIDVMKITLCIDKTARHKPIIGMLLNYRDNHRACMGQSRLTGCLNPLKSPRLGNAYRYHKNDKGIPLRCGYQYGCPCRLQLHLLA
jgi:hypothetical protein